MTNQGQNKSMEEEPEDKGLDARAEKLAGENTKTSANTQEEEIGKICVNSLTNFIILVDIDLTDPAVEAAAMKMQAAFKMKGKNKFGKS